MSLNIFDYKPIQEWNGNIADVGMPTPDGNEKITKIITSSNDSLEATKRCFDLSKTSYYYEKAGTPDVLKIVRSFFSGDGTSNTVTIILEQAFLESPQREQFWSNEPDFPIELNNVERPNPNNLYRLGTGILFSEYMIGENGIEIPSVETKIQERQYTIILPAPSFDISVEVHSTIADYEYHQLPATSMLNISNEFLNKITIDWNIVNTNNIPGLIDEIVSYRIYKSDENRSFDFLDENQLSDKQILLTQTLNLSFDDIASNNLGTYYYWIGAIYENSKGNDVLGVLTPGFQCSAEYTNGVWNYNSALCLSHEETWNYAIFGQSGSRSGDPYIEFVDNLVVSSNLPQQIIITWDSNPTVDPLIGTCYKCESLTFNLEPHYDELDCLIQGDCNNIYIDVSEYHNNESTCEQNGACEDTSLLYQSLCETRGWCSGAGHNDFDNQVCIDDGECNGGVTAGNYNHITCESHGECAGGSWSDTNQSGCINDGECNHGGYTNQSSCIVNGTCSSASYSSPSSCTSNGYCSQYGYWNPSSCTSNGYCSVGGYYSSSSCTTAGICSNTSYASQSSCTTNGSCSNGSDTSSASCASQWCTNPDYADDGTGCLAEGVCTNQLGTVGAFWNDSASCQAVGFCRQQIWSCSDDLSCGWGEWTTIGTNVTEGWCLDQKDFLVLSNEYLEPNVFASAGNTWHPAATWTWNSWTDYNYSWTWNSWINHTWTLNSWTPYNYSWTWNSWTPYNYSWTWWNWNDNVFTSDDYSWNEQNQKTTWPTCVDDLATWVPNVNVQNVPSSYKIYRATNEYQLLSPQEWKYIGESTHQGTISTQQEFIDNTDKMNNETYYYKITQIANDIEGTMSNSEIGYQSS